jgi:gas vesicle protein
MAANPAGELARASALVDLGLRACDAYERPDLTVPLRRTQRRLADPTVHVVVVGEFKKGKSSLVNALLGAAVCPVDDDIATAVPTYLTYAEQPSATLLVREGRDRDGDPDAGVRREPLELARLRETVLEGAHTGDDTAPTGEQVAGAEVQLPRALLQGGLVLVDTPGVGGLGSAHAAATLAAASLAQALIFVTDASQELTRSELDFLRQAQQMCGTVVCVLTKTDLYPAWRRIKERSEARLREAGIEETLIPVSSPLREAAVRDEDPELDAESGYPDLVRALRERVGDSAERALAADAAATVAGVCTQIEAQFQAERAALADPEEARAVVAELTLVKSRVKELKSAAAKWNQTLSDGITDLNADIDHDLRRRIREVVTEASETIELSDPADTWGEMEAWLQARVAHEMLENFNLLRRRATDLSELVGEHFRDASGEVLDRIALPDPRSTVAGEEVDHKIDLDRMGVGKQAMTVLRSGYGGTVMFIMLGMTLGVTLGPIALGIALVMGHRGLKEEKKRQREARQRQATAALRTYCDQIGFVMSKDSRDTLRSIQRQLRDHYTELAEQLEASNAQALERATQAARSTEQERKRRLADVDAELERLRTLRERAVAEGSAR